MVTNFNLQANKWGVEWFIMTFDLVTGDVDMREMGIHLQWCRHPGGRSGVFPFVFVVLCSSLRTYVPILFSLFPLPTLFLLTPFFSLVFPLFPFASPFPFLSLFPSLLQPTYYPWLQSHAVTPSHWNRRILESKAGQWRQESMLRWGMRNGAILRDWVWKLQHAWIEVCYLSSCSFLPLSLLRSSASFPLLQYLAILSSLLFHPLNSPSLLSSTFFPLPLPPLSLGSSTLPPIHWLPLYLQGANRTAWTGEGAHRNKQLVRNLFCFISLFQVQVDTGIVEGSTISFDPMISKVPE